MRLVLALLLSVLLTFSSGWGNFPSAIASFSKQQEAPAQVLYQSRHRLRDKTGDSWQLVLFKRIKNGIAQDIELRIVGFPETTKFAHPQPLKVMLAREKSMEAVDSFANNAPAANVGQYDFTDALSQLSGKSSIKLFLPLADSQTHEVIVPSAVIIEWQDIAARSS